MKRSFKHIVLVIVLGLAMSSFAQNMTVVVPANTVFNSTYYTIKLNDDIEFYFDSMQVKLKLIASQTWTGNDLTFVLPQNTGGALQNGYNNSVPGNRIYLKIKDKTYNCRKEASGVFSTKNGTGIYNFVAGRVDTLNRINLSDNGMAITEDTICNLVGSKINVGGVLLDPYAAIPTFASVPIGLAISNNGTVNYAGSTAGTYRIHINYQACIHNNDSLSVTVLPVLSLGSGAIKYQENACGKSNGLIQVTKPAGAYEPVSYVFSQNNAVINNSTQNILANLSDGTYGVKVIDKYGCVDSTLATLNCVTAPPDMTLNIPNVFNIKGYTLKNFDLLEIYYDSLGQKLKLVTSQYWQGSALVFNLPANYASTGKNGFSEGDKIYLKIFDESGNCRLEVARLATDIATTGTFTTFTAGSTKTATLITAALAQAGFATDSLCTGTAQLSFKGKTDPYSAAPTYTSNVSGLDLSSSGEVTYASSTAGTYEVSINTNICLASKTVPITILPQWSLSTSNIVLKANDCGQTNGSIKLLAPNAAYPPLTYSFTATSYSYTGSVDSIANIGNENFNVSITDRYQCVGKGKVIVNCIPVQANTNMTLVVSNNYSLQNYTMSLGDEVEVYYDSLGVKLALVAKAPWNNGDLSFQLPLNTASAGKNGFNEGDKIYLKILDKQNNCRVQIFSLIANQNDIVFKSDTSVASEGLTGGTLTVSYAIDSLCDNFSQIKIGTLADPYAPQPQFESIPAGLGFWANGNIDYDSSVIGTYRVKVNHPTCVYQNGAIPMSILPQIPMAPTDVIIKENECGKPNGVLKIVAPAVAYPPLSYSFIKRGNSKGYTGTNDTLGGLDEGQYFLTVTDRYNCKGRTVVNFNCKPPTTVITTDISNNDFILSDINPSNSSVVFDCDKTITVLNSKGKLVNSLPPYTIWAGTDANGNSLPTGLYIIYCDKKRLGEVTIVR